MPIHKQVKSLFRNIFRKAQVEQDLDKELEIYFDMTAEEKVSRGMSVDEAQRAARMEMGGIEQVKEEVRVVRLGASIETLWQDIRFVRMLLKTLAVTSAVILSLSLGIGANTAIFSIVNAVLMRSLPVDQPEELVLFGEGNVRGFSSNPSGRWEIFSYPMYKSPRDHQASLQDVAAFRTQLDRLNVRPEGGGNDSGHLAWGRLVSGNYFSVLGARAPADSRRRAPGGAGRSAQLRFLESSFAPFSFRDRAGAERKSHSRDGGRRCATGVLWGVNSVVFVMWKA